MSKFLTGIVLALLLACGTSVSADPGHVQEWGWDAHEEDRCGEYEEPPGRRSDCGEVRRHLDPNSLGPYLGLHAIAAPEAFRNGARRRVGGNRNVDESYGFGARIGYRVHPHVALELHSEWVEGFDLQQLPGDHSEIRTWTNTVNGKLFLGHGRFQPYALGGAGVQRAWVRNPTPGGVDFDDTAFVGRVGGGLDLHLTDHVVLNFEGTYLVPTGDLDDYDSASIGLGLLYRF